VDERVRLSYFVPTFDVTSERVLALTGHGPDFVGAVLDAFHRHGPPPRPARRDRRLLAGTSVADLVERHAGLFAGLRLPD
jgi:hypothetical protein